jgi:hypothetical protein
VESLLLGTSPFLMSVSVDRQVKLVLPRFASMKMQTGFFRAAFSSIQEMVCERCERPSKVTQMGEKKIR